MNITITGACGIVGTALYDLSGSLTLHDRRKCHDFPDGSPFYVGDLNNTSFLLDAVSGADVLIHLAAEPDVKAGWEDVLHSNIRGTQSVMQAAVETGVARVIFASSNHVVGMVEEDHKPRIYYPDHGIRIDEQHPTRPDGYYGISKVFGENLGRYHAENGGPRFYAVRIGAVRPADQDHPYAYAQQAVAKGKARPGDQQWQDLVGRLKGLWLSRRDCLQIFRLLLTYDGPPYDVFNAVSANASRWLSIEKARTRLGYQPHDNGDDWASPPD